MPDQRPVRRERLKAAASFVGIGLATLAALDFLVTGGFDFNARRSASTYVDPLSAVAAQAPASTVTALAWSDPAMADPVDPALGEVDPAVADDALPAEELIDERADARSDSVAAPSEDELYREIANLYAEQDARAAQAAEDDEEQVLEDADEEEPAFYDERDLNPDWSAPDSQF